MPNIQTDTYIHTEKYIYTHTHTYKTYIHTHRDKYIHTDTYKYTQTKIHICTNRQGDKDIQERHTNPDR